MHGIWNGRWEGEKIYSCIKKNETFEREVFFTLVFTMHQVSNKGENMKCPHLLYRSRTLNDRLRSTLFIYFFPPVSYVYAEVVELDGFLGYATILVYGEGGGRGEGPRTSLSSVGKSPHSPQSSYNTFIKFALSKIETSDVGVGRFQNLPIYIFTNRKCKHKNLYVSKIFRFYH